MLRDRVALVTGGASGIGRATAVAFARAGARVVVSDVDDAGGEETVARITGEDSQAIFLHGDVTDPAAVQALVRGAVDRFGRLDCAFNGAGITGGPGMPTADCPEDVWQRVIAVNLTGVWLCMKYELQEMLRQKSGVIVNAASVLGTVGLANTTAYTAAKHGVLGATRVAAIEYAPHGIRVNAVCPGFVDTPMLANLGLTTDPLIRAGIETLHPMGRLGRPEEIAEAVIWLCSDAASFVTGHSMLIDGGYTAQ
jgi:NAD(P)-dependent dehydrogenase (short-subunit alcohol dehydrogenase family)